MFFRCSGAAWLRSKVSRLGILSSLALLSMVSAAEPPVIPIGLDAYRHWERWPYQRIGARAYMRSTYDRRGGNVSFRSPGAGSVVEAMIDQGVISSFRKPNAIRFGVSPLAISHQDIYEAVARLKRILAQEIWKQPKYKKVSV